MYYLSPFLLGIFFFSTVLCDNVEHRNPRLIGRTRTSTVLVTSTSTSLVPSSCVHVEATVTCRNKRNFWFSAQNESTTEPQTDARTESPKKTPAQSWGEYLGLFAATVTVTQTKIETSTATDPRLVVTYGVKTCIPTGFPMNLSTCDIQTAPVEIPTSTIVPTATIDNLASTILVTVVEGDNSVPVSDINNNEIDNVVNQVNNVLEASNGGPGDLSTNRQQRATDPLP